MSALICPCGLEKAPQRCCEPILVGTKIAGTALELMRSRYSAYHNGNIGYLLASWSPETRPKQLILEPDQKWLGLKIKRIDAGDTLDDTGLVEFIARYKISGKAYRLHELSRFVRDNAGVWLYLDGEQI